MRAPPLILFALGGGLCMQAGLALWLYATTHQAYDRGDAFVFLTVLPSLALTLCSYLLIRSVRLWNTNRATAKSEFPATGRLTTGVVVGVVGFWLALASGPHLAGFFVFWPLLLQLALFVWARVSVHRRVNELMSRKAPK